MLEAASREQSRNGSVAGSRNASPDGVNGRRSSRENSRNASTSAARCFGTSADSNPNPQSKSNPGPNPNPNPSPNPNPNPNPDPDPSPNPSPNPNPNPNPDPSPNPNPNQAPRRTCLATAPQTTGHRRSGRAVRAASAPRRVDGAPAWSKCHGLGSLGSAPARLLRLLRARLAALGSSALPGRGRPTERPASKVADLTAFDLSGAAATPR
eukprot:scaffold113317_cov51-Phaeocystis_antarctica.AAC.1